MGDLDAGRMAAGPALRPTLRAPRSGWESDRAAVAVVPRARLRPSATHRCHHVTVTFGAPQPRPDALPVGLHDALEGFVAHVRDERGRSAHTVRAYTADVTDLLGYCADHEVVDPAGISLVHLRGWLALQSRHGRARATLARHAAAARAFTAWCARRGLAPTDAGQRLASPRIARTLPVVLDAGQAATLMDHAATAADDGAVVGLRDRSMIELLYATGIRVAELCSADVSDVDLDRRTVLVTGKGDKQRTVPFGLPAAGALRDWLAVRAQLARPLEREGRGALYLGVRGGRIDPRTVRSIVHRLSADAGVPEVAPHGLRHAAATHVLDSPTGRANTSSLLRPTPAKSRCDVQEMRPRLHYRGVRGLCKLRSRLKQTRFERPVQRLGFLRENL